MTNIYITTTDDYTSETECYDSAEAFIEMVRECHGDEAADALNIRSDGVVDSSGVYVLDAVSIQAGPVAAAQFGEAAGWDVAVVLSTREVEVRGEVSLIRNPEGRPARWGDTVGHWLSHDLSDWADQQGAARLAVLDSLELAALAAVRRAANS